MTDNFGPDWARRKLNMPRRAIELTAYLDRWLPELKSASPGLVVDIGCGPGDLLALCQLYGHECVGVDAPTGTGGMGDAYLDLCREERRSLGVTVFEIGMQEFVANSDMVGKTDAAVCINLRGSIEQCFSYRLTGEPHDRHHNCRLCDWDCSVDTQGEFLLFFMQCRRLLRQYGLVMISANGTATTDSWYDEAIRHAALDAGLILVQQAGPLIHKWIKP